MAAKMSSAYSIVDFVQRFQEIQAQRNSADALIQDLMYYCNDIENELSRQNQKLTNSELDLQDATRARRDLQQRIQIYEVKYEKLARENEALKHRNPYIMVLIDGDGLIFQEKWIKQGMEGGKKAAYALRNAMAEKFGEDIEDIEVVAKVVANLTGLARAMHRDGGSDAAMKEFALGFTQAKASFDFIDVGFGKERADSKIKELSRWNLRNHNCKHLVLGISHDSGYAPFLDELFQDNTTRNRLSVLEGVATVKEILATQVNIVKAEPDIFRKEKLVERIPNSSSASGLPAAAAPVSHVIQEMPPRTASPTASINSAQARTPSSSYAGIASASPPPQMTMPLAPKPMPPPRQRSSQSPIYQLIPPQQPDWNPGLRGLDEPIRVISAVLEAIKKRKDNDKLCNNHFLRGPCAKQDVCPFVHDYKATEEEKKAIAVLARQNPCTSGQYCDQDDCIYGHHCPSIKDGVCQHPHCRFKEDDHPPGTKYTYKTSYSRSAY